MTQDTETPRYALRPADVWDDYESKMPDNGLAGFFSTYWCDFDDISIPEDSLNGEFVRYSTNRAQQRPSAVYSGVIKPTASAHTSAMCDVFNQVITLAHEAEEEPVISYSQGDISSVAPVWTNSDDTECVAVTEAGCAGYFDDTLTLIERREDALLRTSLKPGSESKHMKEMFAHGFQAVVRNRLDESGDSE